MKSNIKISPYIILGAVVVFKLWISLKLFMLFSGMPFFDGDSCSRIFTAWGWKENLTLAPLAGDWLNLHFWILGAAMKLVPDSVYAPVMVNLLFSAAALVSLFLIGRALSGGRSEAGLLAAGIAAVNPLLTGLGLSGLAEPGFYLFVLAGIYFTLFYTIDGKRFSLYIAAVSFMLSTGMRYEGWFFAAVFSAVAIVDCCRPGIEGIGKRFLHGSAVLGVTWLFVIYWLIVNRVYFGSFTAFKTIFLINNMEGPAILGVGRMEVLATFFKNSYHMTGPLLPVLMIPALYLWRKERVRRTYLYFLAFPFVMLIYTYMFARAGSGAAWVEKSAAVFFMLLLPVAGYWFGRALFFAGKDLRYFLAIGIAAGLFVFNDARGHYDPEYYIPVGARERDSARKIGVLVKTLYARDILNGDENVLLDMPVRPYGTHYSNIWNICNIKVCRPGNIIWARKPDYYYKAGEPRLNTEDNPSVFDSPPGALEEYIESKNVALLILVNGDNEKKLDSIASRCTKIGEYTLYLNRRRKPLCPRLKTVIEDINDSWNGCYWNHPGGPLKLIRFSGDQQV